MKKILLPFIALALFTAGCAAPKDEPLDKAKDVPLDKAVDNQQKNDPNQYRWSTMNEGPYNDKISYATSMDLGVWEDSAVTLAEHASVPGAVVKDGIIYVYFVDVSQDGIPEQIGLITSKDNGTTWSAKQYITVAGVGSHVPVDPAPFLLEDGRIRLYYFDGSQKPALDGSSKEMLYNYSAISDDGITFTQEEGYRFADTSAVFDPDVEKVDGTYYMYVGDLIKNQTVVATSADGITFTRQGIAYANGAVPDVFYKDGMYHLYTAGIDLSTSTDGLTFTGTHNRFQSKNGGVTADASVVELPNGMYMMAYKTSMR